LCQNAYDVRGAKKGRGTLGKIAGFEREGNGEKQRYKLAEIEQRKANELRVQFATKGV